MSDEKETEVQSEAVRVYKSQDVAAFFGVKGDTHLATFDPQTPEGARLLIAAKMQECKSIKDYINLEIKIKHLFAHPASRVDPATGEFNQWTRVCIITPDNTVIDCGSKGIQESLGLIAMIRGQNPPWEPPVRAIVKAREIGGGRNFYQLEPVIDSVIVKPVRVRKS